MLGRLFRYRCGATAHQTQTEGASDYTVTVHDGDWAYCPTGGTEGHAWQEITPVPLEQVRRRVAPPGPPAAA